MIPRYLLRSNEDGGFDFNNANIVMNCNQGSRTSLGVDPTNLFGDESDIKGRDGTMFGDDAGADEQVVGAAATASTVASSKSSSRGKMSGMSTKGGEREAKHLHSPCKPPESPPLMRVMVVKEMGPLLEVLCT